MFVQRIFVFVMNRTCRPVTSGPSRQPSLQQRQLGRLCRLNIGSRHTPSLPKLLNIPNGRWCILVARPFGVSARCLNMANTDTFLFTSESVNEGHPDKLCDQVRLQSLRVRWLLPYSLVRTFPFNHSSITVISDSRLHTGGT